MSPIRNQIINEMSAQREILGLSEHAFGLRYAKCDKFFPRLRNSGVTISVIERVLEQSGQEIVEKAVEHELEIASPSEHQAL